LETRALIEVFWFDLRVIYTDQQLSRSQLSKFNCFACSMIYIQSPKSLRVNPLPAQFKGPSYLDELVSDLTGIISSRLEAKRHSDYLLLLYHFYLLILLLSILELFRGSYCWLELWIFLIWNYYRKLSFVHQTSISRLIKARYTFVWALGLKQDIFIHNIQDLQSRTRCESLRTQL